MRATEIIYDDPRNARCHLAQLLVHLQGDALFPCLAVFAHNWRRQSPEDIGHNFGLCSTSLDLKPPLTTHLKFYFSVKEKV